MTQKIITQKRKFQLYVVGTAKSGTHSLAGIFSDHYRSGHEVRWAEMIRMTLDMKNGMIGRDSLAKWIRKKDREDMYEVDSSQLNYWFLDILSSEFPGAKFILTIRDCYLWLESFVNHSLERPCDDLWKALRDLRFKKDQFKYAEQEDVLRRHGLYTLDGYFSYWAEHNERVIRSVPSERLLIVRTDEISQSFEKMAGFLGISSDTLDHRKAFLFKAKQKFNILEKIDRQFLAEKAKAHCEKLMNKFFPEQQRF